jgi:23S rRNA (pseudouridine1915-N3)-methyltransferase
MKLSLHVVGRLKEPYFIDAEREYLKRLRPYASLTVVEAKTDAAQLAGIPAGATLVAFDERGPSLSSVEFARDVIAAHELRGGGAPLALAIGGADGHPPELRARAQRLVSFGKLTIAHRLVRLLVLEQVYRAFRIVRGEPYHRE